MSIGTALKEAGGESFLDAVKEISDKQNLTIGEGKDVYRVIPIG